MSVRRLRAPQPYTLANVLCRAARLVAVGLSVTSFAACAPAARPEQHAVRRELSPQWQDVFDGTPEVYVVVRPPAIKRDTLYGTFFKKVLRAAHARSPMRGATSLEALEGAEEIIVGLRKGESGEDAAIVIRGVPAHLDPEKITDATGQPVLSLLDTHAKVPEYDWSDRQNALSGSLFVLPGRTWVGVSGEARARARQALASPFGRPVPKVDADALAIARLDATRMSSSRRFTKSPLVGPLMKKLRAVTLALMPGKGGVVAKLQYADEDASAWAEMHVRRVVEELSHQTPPKGAPSLEWLKTAQISHHGNTVAVRIAVPARLLEDLPNVSPSDLDF